jgi:CHAT domain-containing protein
VRLRVSLTAGRCPGRAFRSLLFAGALSAALGPLSAASVLAANESAPLDRYAGLPADSTEARLAVVSEDAKAFRQAFDAALAATARNDARWSSLFPQAAEDYRKTTGDSLLLSDLAFARRASAASLKRWRDAVALDEAASAQQGSDPSKAAPLFRSAAQTYREIRHLRREAVAWGSLGVACWNAGDLDCVEEAYRRALLARRQLGDSLLIGRTLNGLGSLHFKRGDYDSALVYYQEAKAVRERLGRPADLGTTLTYLGNVYYRLGDLKAARTYYQDALLRLGPGGPQGPVSDARAGLANVWSDLGEYRQAAQIYEQEALAAAARGDIKWAAILRGNLGFDLFQLGDQAGALRELQTARDTLTSLQDSYELARVQNPIGLVYLDMSDYPRALKAFQEAQQLATESGNKPVLGSALVNLGVSYYEMGLLDRSQSSLDQARQVYEALGDSLEMNEVVRKIALVKAKSGHYDEALELHRRVLAWDARNGLLGQMAYTHANIASVLDDLGREEEARREFTAGADLARQLGRNDVLWRCELGVGHTFERSGDLDSARVYNQKAIDVLESVRGRNFSEETKAAFLGKWSYVYEAQIHVLAKQYREHPTLAGVEEAFQTAERGKARAFLDALSQGNIDLAAGVDPGTQKREEELEFALNELRHRLRVADAKVPADTLRAWKKELRELEVRSDEIEEQTRINNPQRAVLGTDEPLSLAEVRGRLLGKGSGLLLEYSLGDSASYVFAITKQETRLYALPPRDVIEAEVRHLRSTLASAAPSGDAQLLASATALYRMILLPVADAIGKSKSIYIIPDGLLHLLPFDVLFEKAPSAPPTDPEARGRFFGSLPYALAKQDTYYGPSASVLAMMASAPKPSGKERELLAVGDPAFSKEGAPLDSTSLSPLPESRHEVESIARQFPAAQCTVLLGPEAREKTIMEPGFLAGYRILHFATHGLVDERRPERSSLAFSYPQDPSEDGYLAASEIYRLHLNADLVVLSACETGLGRMVRGEGVLGLPRAFFYAGARSVLVSLWSVSDRSTALLMTSFYGALIKKGEPTSRALVTAKASLRKNPDTSHPFYWAPFVLIGPSERENSKAKTN